MSKKKITVEPDLTVEFAFPSLISLKKRQFRLCYEPFHHNYLDDQYVDYKVLSLDGYTSKFTFKNYIVELIQQDYITLINSIQSRDNTSLSLNLESLIEDIRDTLKETMISEFYYDDKKYVKFRKIDFFHCEVITANNHVEELILSKTEPYVFVYLDAIDALIIKLEVLKNKYEIDMIRYGSIPTTRIPYSFRYIKYKNQPGNLNTLCQGLIDAQLISKDTDPKDFKIIFSGQPVSNLVAWVGKISALHHFVKSLHAEGNRKINYVFRDHFKIACKCFTLPNDPKGFDWERLSGQKSPRNIVKLDGLINIL